MTLQEIYVCFTFILFFQCSCINSSKIFPIGPSIVLCEGKNQTGTCISTHGAYIPDMATKNFNNQAQSVCVNGTWLLYEHSQYNKENGNMEYISGQSHCSNLLTIAGKVSSLRFAGSAIDTAFDSITFYYDTYFQGQEEYFTDIEANLEILGNNSKSLVVTGSKGWRLFEKKHHQGESICIQPKKKSRISRMLNEPLVLLVPNIKEYYAELMTWPISSVMPDTCF